MTSLIKLVTFKTHNNIFMLDRPSTILYIDDEQNNLSSFRANFREYYTIFTANSVEEGINILRNNDIHIIITDQRMPDMTGVNFLESILEEFPYQIRLLLTGYADIDILLDALSRKLVYRYLLKPFDDVELRTAIDNALEVYYLRKDNRELQKKLSELNSN